VTPEQYAAVRGGQVRQAQALGTVDEVRIEGLNRTKPEVVRQLVDSKAGEPLTEEKLGADLRRVFGTRDYETISYRVVGGETGPRALLIQPTEKSWGPDYLRFGLGLASDFSGDSQFNLLAQYRRTWLNHLGAEWLTELQIGQDARLSTEFYQPLDDTGRWFVAPNALVSQQSRGVFANGDKVAEYLVSVAQGGVDVGRTLGTWGQLRLGAVYSRINARVDTGSPLLPSLREPTAGVRANLFVDQTDAAWFPREGYSVVADGYAALDSFGSAATYQRIDGTVRGIKSWGAHTLNAAASGGTDLSSDMPSFESFSLGGPLRLSAYRINEFAGRKYWFSRLMYYNRALPLPELLGSGIYVGGSAEVGRIVDRVDSLGSPGTLWSGSAFLGADTFIGPIYLGLGLGTSGNWSLYLFLGAP
jgi:NTE family protein